MASEKKCSTRALQDPNPDNAVVLDTIHCFTPLDGWHAIPGWGAPTPEIETSLRKARVTVRSAPP